MTSILNILISLAIAGVCGWVAGIIMKNGQGHLVNIILGIVGGFVGSILFGILGTSFIGNIIASIAGSCLVIFVIRLIKR